MSMSSHRLLDEAEGSSDLFISQWRPATKQTDVYLHPDERSDEGLEIKLTCIVIISVEPLSDAETLYNALALVPVSIPAVSAAFTQCVCALRISVRRKEPQAVSDDAQRKFGDARAISSDMFFGKQDNSEVKHFEHFKQMPHGNMSSVVLNAVITDLILALLLVFF